MIQLKRFGLIVETMLINTKFNYFVIMTILLNLHITLVVGQLRVSHGLNVGSKKKNVP